MVDGGIFGVLCQRRSSNRFDRSAVGGIIGRINRDFGFANPNREVSDAAVRGFVIGRCQLTDAAGKDAVSVCASPSFSTRAQRSEPFSPVSS